jgi:hypothetical protein
MKSPGGEIGIEGAPNSRKSPAEPAEIPVFGRPAAETGSDIHCRTRGGSGFRPASLVRDRAHWEQKGLTAARGWQLRSRQSPAALDRYLEIPEAEYRGMPVVVAIGVDD